MLYYFCCMLNQIIKFMKNFNHWSMLDRVVFFGSSSLFGSSVGKIITEFEYSYFLIAILFLFVCIIMLRLNNN